MNQEIPNPDLQRLQDMLTRQDIYDCLVRFCRGIDRFDRTLFLTAFHDDAIISAGEYVAGPVEIYEWAKQMHEQGQVATQHCVFNHRCDIDGETAHSEIYYQFVGRNRDQSNWIAGGRYIDRLELRNSQWRIAFRSNVIEWSGLLPTMPIPFSEVADLALNGLSSRTEDDPSYQRPLKNQRPLKSPSAQ